jgi:hypothetical protein
MTKMAVVGIVDRGIFIAHSSLTHCCACGGAIQDGVFSCMSMSCPVQRKSYLIDRRTGVVYEHPPAGEQGCWPQPMGTYDRTTRILRRRPASATTGVHGFEGVEMLKCFLAYV